MAFNLSGLVNNIRGSVNNLVDQLTGQLEPGALHPADKRITSSNSRINQENWLKLPFPYSFAVYDVGVQDFTNLFGEFQLPIAPSEINQREEFAISITPTQGGTVVTHSGNKYKTLTISGTTGVAPFRGSGGVDKASGTAIFQPNELKYKSGYEVFLQLRNYFRSYYEYKKVNSANATTRNHRLTFKNYKDGEFLVVELLNFDMKRSASRPMMYDYTMEFKVLKHLTFETPDLDFLARLDNNLNNALNKIDTARGVFLRSQGILRQIESTYDGAVLEPLRKISLAVKALQGIETTAADMGNRIINKTVTEANTLAILTGLKEQQEEFQRTGSGSSVVGNANIPTDLSASVQNNRTQALTGLGEVLLEVPSSDFPEATQEDLELEKEEVQTLPRSFYENTISDLRRIKANAEDAFNLGSAAYDDIFDRTSTVSADSTRVVTDEEFILLGAFNEAIVGINAVLSTDRLFKSSVDEKINDMVSRFDNQIDLQSLPAVQQITMPQSTDLERLALQYLGDAKRWVEIAEINDLKSPFVVQDQSDTRSNIVRPGDKLLIPQPLLDGFSQAPKGKENNATRGLSELEKSLGVDLRVTNEFDLALGSNDDLEIVAGADNMAQAVVLKLGYEKGELLSSPNIGVGLGIGNKFPPLSEIKDNLVQSLNQDPRIERVEDLALRRDGSSLNLAFTLRIKQVDIPVPVQIKL